MTDHDFLLTCKKICALKNSPINITLLLAQKHSHFAIKLYFKNKELFKKKKEKLLENCEENVWMFGVRCLNE